MKLLSYSLMALLVGFSAVSCTSDDTNNAPKDFLVFGHFYGMCGGEECVEIFKITDNALKEDGKDEYPNRDKLYEGDYTTLATEDFDKVKDLRDHFPKKLLDETDLVLGCPDCADGGGLYIEYKSGDTHRFWFIDQSQASVPSYLHDFMDLANEKISLINAE